MRSGLPFSDASEFIYRIENSEATVTEYTGIASEVVIPRVLGGAPDHPASVRGDDPDGVA